MSALRRALARFLRRAGKGFAIAAGLKLALALVPSLLRSGGNPGVILRILLDKSNFSKFIVMPGRYGCFLAALLAVFEGVMSLLDRTEPDNEYNSTDADAKADADGDCDAAAVDGEDEATARRRRRRAALRRRVRNSKHRSRHGHNKGGFVRHHPVHSLMAGSVAGFLAILCLPRSSRLDVAVFLVVRAAEVLVRCARLYGLVPEVPHADSALFALCTAHITWTWVFRRERLDPSYAAFLDNNTGSRSGSLPVLAYIHSGTVPGPRAPAAGSAAANAAAVAAGAGRALPPLVSFTLSKTSAFVPPVAAGGPPAAATAPLLLARRVPVVNGWQTAPGIPLLNPTLADAGAAGGAAGAAAVTATAAASGAGAAAEAAFRDRDALMLERDLARTFGTTFVTSPLTLAGTVVSTSTSTSGGTEVVSAATAAATAAVAAATATSAGAAATLPAPYMLPATFESACAVHSQVREILCCSVILLCYCSKSSFTLTSSILFVFYSFS